MWKTNIEGSVYRVAFLFWHNLVVDSNQNKSTIRLKKTMKVKKGVRDDIDKDDLEAFYHTTMTLHPVSASQNPTLTPSLGDKTTSHLN